MIAARSIDVGLLDPGRFHATYAGIAYAADRDAQPVVMWGRARAHVCLGQSQDRHAELAADLDVPVVRRPLGGGAVWVDELQYCYVLIAPLACAPARPADWFGWALAPAIATFRHYALPVERRDQDLWLHGRKIAGSGAATLGRCAVFASSFLLRFPAGRFARCILSPSREFHGWLLGGLRQAMTDWHSHRIPPQADELYATFRAAVGDRLGWRLADSALGAAERAACEEALAEPAEPAASGRRMVADGIRLNAVMSLHGYRRERGVELHLVRDGRVIRRRPACGRVV